jgi:O-acetyl-ADP-ribose deacetylase (regulator of RNase III)
LDAAKKLSDVSQISLPSISTGYNGGPSEVVAKITLQKLFLWCIKQSGQIKQIRICNIEEDKNKIWLKVMHQYFQKAQDFDIFNS